MRFGASNRGTVWMSGGILSWMFVLPFVAMYWMLAGSFQLMMWIYVYPVRSAWRAYQRSRRRAQML
jgi:hypothetical protein